jgi:hypothetical protein
MDGDGAEYVPHPPMERVAHYYGDAVRQLFIVAAAAMLIGAPFYTDVLRAQLPFIMIGALLAVAIAALANPHNKSVFLAGAVGSGVGLVIYESWALYNYFDSTWLEFILREAIAIVFLAAFYFNMKTVRAFVLHTVGRRQEAGEFERPSTPRIGRKTTWREEFIPWFLRNGNNRNAKTTVPETGPRINPGRSREEFIPKEHPYEDQL